MGLGHYILDDDKRIVRVANDGINEPGFLEWERVRDEKMRRVAHDTVGGIDVSTIFLGMDHSFGLGVPILFETMTFKGRNSDHLQLRYCCYANAERGHQEVVELLKKGRTSEQAQEAAEVPHICPWCAKRPDIPSVVLGEVEQ